MDLSKLRELIRIFEQAAITELDYEVEGVRIRLRKEKQLGVSEISLQRGSSPAQERTGPAGSLEANPTAANSEASAVLERAVSEERPVISAPMVGVFYRSPGPDVPPFVRPGDFVEEGQTVCIIEAMKLMNEVRSPLSGKLVEVLVENGEPVEFGQPLFVLEPVE